MQQYSIDLLWTADDYLVPHTQISSAAEEITIILNAENIEDALERGKQALSRDEWSTKRIVELNVQEIGNAEVDLGTGVRIFRKDMVKHEPNTLGEKALKWLHKK